MKIFKEDISDKEKEKLEILEQLNLMKETYSSDRKTKIISDKDNKDFQ